MKSTVLLLMIGLHFCFSIQAQEISVQDIFLFSEYTDGKVLMKDKSLIDARLNYDRLNKEMFYQEGDQDMILQGLDKIDTIYIADRIFVPNGNHFIELVRINGKTLMVDWKTKVIDIGKKGAMGMITHGGSINKLDIKILQDGGYDMTGNNVYKLEAANKYAIRLNGKTLKFDSPKSFCKLLPKDKQKEAEGYIKGNKINIDKPDDVVTLINTFL